MDWQKEFLFPAWKHQGEEFENHKDSVARALHWQMRTGKTKAMVDLACYLYAQGRIDGVLIVAPNNVHANWMRREIPAHHWIGVPYKAIAWNTAESKHAHYDQAFGEMLNYRKGLAWYAVNVEATVLASQRAYISAFMKKRKFLLIVDETHEWRRPGSKRSRYLRQVIAKKAIVKRNLSGTMIDNNPMHAFAQYEILKPGALGFEKYPDFEKYFGIWEHDTIYIGGRPRNVPKLVDFCNMDELRNKMAQWTSYVYRDQCDDLPELVPAEAEFELLGQQKRIYNELVRGSLIKLDTGEDLDIDPETGVITKLQNIRSGFVKDMDGQVHWLVKDEENPAFQTLLELVRHTDGKCIIWCKYRLEIEALTALLNKNGFRAASYYGRTPTKERPKVEERFRSDPKLKCLVAQPKACGQGLDFSAGEHIIWFSHIHGDLIGRRQADERCTKMGGRKIAVTDMVGCNTVDSKILADQDAKISRTEYLTGEGLRELLRICP